MRIPSARACLTIAALVLAAIPSLAQASYWYVTPMGGQMMFADSLRNDEDTRLPLDDAPYFGGRIGYHFHPRWAIQVGGGYSPTSIDVPDGETVKVKHVAGDLLFSPLVFPVGDLFIMGGGGGIEHKPDITHSLDSGTFDWGGGLHLWFNDWVGLTLEARDIMVLADNSRDHFLASWGLNFAFGRAKPPVDSDGDGVIDKKDKCPNTPTGATVDVNGCPSDADGDGVLDGIDKCPDTPKGATVDRTGCPMDSDNDGVPDGIDQCSNTPNGATVDARGCPMDSDGDGVPDGLDKCPNTPAGATVTADGCPAITQERAKELVSTGMIRLGNIHFETGKSTIMQDSYAALDSVGQVLTNFPQLKIEVGGHTDSRGKAAMNQKLSEARAQAVVDYLKSKYSLSDDQLVAKGYGESKPIASNSNASGMARNRRVEFVVINKEMLEQIRQQQH
jgi:OOP family OmpA-OmpF porin